MPRIDNLVFCDGCGVEITWSPVIKGHKVYCCRDCSDGLACNCGERMELEDDRRSKGNDSLAPD